MFGTLTLAEDAEVDDVVDWAQAVETHAAAAGAPIDYLGLAPLFSVIRGYRTESALWVLSRAEEDPLMEGGRLPMPAAERRKLLKLLDAGLDFPHMYIAHESPLSDGVKALAPARKPGDVPITPALARRLIGTEAPAPQHVERTAGRLAKVLAGVEAGIRSLHDLADPVVFGAVPVPALSGDTPGDDMAAWFVLARWAW